MDQFDYIIVGAGSSGCVLAARLTEDPGTKVLVDRGRGQREADDSRNARGLVPGDAGRLGRLGLFLGAGALRGPAAHSGAARAGRRRLLVDQRHDVFARPSAGLRPMGANGRERLGFCRCSALFPQIRGELARRIGGSRRGRPADGHQAPNRPQDLSRDHGDRRAYGLPRARRLSRRVPPRASPRRISRSIRAAAAPPRSCSSARRWRAGT